MRMQRTGTLLGLGLWLLCAIGCEELPAEGSSDAGTDIDGADDQDSGSDEGQQADAAVDSGPGKDAEDTSDAGTEPGADAGTEPGADAGTEPEADPCADLNCGDFAACIADDDDAACVCDDGYYDVDGDCTRDECIALGEDTPPCAAHATGCMDEDPEVDAGIACECDEGYRQAGTECVRDECIALDGATPPCQQYAGGCQDDDPAEDVGLNCNCDQGYRQDGADCVRDECEPLDANDPPPCGAGGMCVDDDPAEGNASCMCDPTYQEDAANLLCVPDECAMSTEPDGLCGANATCDDSGNLTALDYECTCTGNFARCSNGSTPQDPCDIDLDSDPDHCGQCGAACAGNLACGGGQCDQAAAWLTSSANSFCAAVGQPSGKGGHRLKCWGSNGGGAINRNDSARSYSSPVSLSGNLDLVSVAFGASHNCALADDDRLICWGSNAVMQLGATNVNLDVAYTTAQGATDVVVGGGGTCVLYEDGKVRCFGGPAATNLPSNTATPRLMSLGGSATQIAANGGAYCALLTNGEVSCWGNGTGYTRVRLPNGSTVTDAVKLALGGADTSFNTACVLRASNEVFCGNLLNASLLNLELSSPNSEPLVDIGAGLLHVCVLDGAGQVYCAGDNLAIGVLPDPSMGSNALQALPDLTDLLDITASDAATCGRRSTGQVVCWGANSNGELGNGSVGGTSSNPPNSVQNVGQLP